MKTVPFLSTRSKMFYFKKLIQASIRTVGRAVASFNYSFKQRSQVLVTENTEENIDRRYDCALNFCTLNEDRMFFIDEAGFQVNMRRRYCRPKKGEKAV